MIWRRKLLTLWSALLSGVGEVIASDFRGWRGSGCVRAVTTGNHCKALAVHQMLGWRAMGKGSLLSSKANANRGTLSCFFSSSRRFQDP